MPVKIFEGNAEQAVAAVETQVNEFLERNPRGIQVTHISTALTGAGATTKFVVTLVYEVVGGAVRTGALR